MCLALRFKILSFWPLQQSQFTILGKRGVSCSRNSILAESSRRSNKKSCIPLLMDFEVGGGGWLGGEHPLHPTHILEWNEKHSLCSTETRDSYAKISSTNIFLDQHYISPTIYIFHKYSVHIHNRRDILYTVIPRPIILSSCNHINIESLQRLTIRPSRHTRIKEKKPNPTQ